MKTQLRSLLVLTLAAACSRSSSTAATRSPPNDPGATQREELNSLVAELTIQLSRLEQRVVELEAKSGGRSAQIDETKFAIQKIEDGLKALEETLEGAGLDRGQFRRGQRAPTGLSPTEIKQYAVAQGDPHRGRFSLEEAMAGDRRLLDKNRGRLVAVFDTSKGKFECILDEDKAPATVANFVGLARGVRAFRDADGQWVRRPLYDGTIFHRVIKGFMIQGGDPLGTGAGGPGYVIPDEIDPDAKHQPGVLSMANRGPQTGGSQFFISVSTPQHLDGRHTIFGQCAKAVPTKISKVRTGAAARPIIDVAIRNVTITRKKRRKQ